MKIVTLTLNPAFDLHCTVGDFAPYHENLARVDTTEAGGKGVNISRALSANGVENLCFAVLGEENGDSFAKRLLADGISCRFLTVAGRIRENLTIHTDKAPETRISFLGFSADDRLLERVESALAEELRAECILTFTGRVPEGISMSAVKKFLQKIEKRGVKIVVDSRSFTLEDLLEVRPYLIKPNEEEIALYLGREIGELSEAADAARELHERGIENVMISLGAKGALLHCSEGAFAAKPPAVEVKSTVGAGDSAIGGFLAAKQAGASAEEGLRLAVAYGSAACMGEGTRPPKRENIEKILPLIDVCRI